MRFIRPQALVALLPLLVAAQVRAAPRITETFAVAAPADFELREPEDLRRLASFPASRLTSLDEHAPAIGRPEWFKLRLERANSETVAELSLRLLAGTQRRIEAHLVEQGQWVASATSGYRVRPEKRTHPSVKLILPLAAWKGNEAEVYVRTECDFRTPLDPMLLNRTEVEREGDTHLALTVAYYAGAFFILIVQAVLYFYFRERAIRDYLLLTAGFLATAVVRSGHFDFALGGAFGSSFYLGDWALPLRILTMFLIIRAFRSFFELRSTAPRLDSALHLLAIALGVTCVVSTVLPARLLAIPVPLASLLTAAAVLATCFFAVRARMIGARLICTGWLGLLLLALYSAATSLGWMSDFLGGTAALYLLAALWELFFNTLGLTYKFRHLQQVRHQKELRELEVAGLERMVRVLCHDLSTPLATIGMTTDLLQLNREAGRPVDLDATTHRLQLAVKSIKEIVDSTRNVEALKLHGGNLPLEPVDLCAVFDDAERMVHDKLSRKRLTLRKTDWPENAVVLAEPRMLRLSVIANALSNAVKFSSSGGTIEVSLRQEGASMVLRIRDHGVGIPREMREAFERSGRIQSRRGTMNEEGTGFGMMLMRDFTKAMRGEFRLESRTAEESATGHGTTVEIRLPVAVAAASVLR